MLFFRVDDGKAVFATHRIKLLGSDAVTDLLLERSGGDLVCYGQGDVENAKKRLKAQSVEFVVEEILQDEIMKKKSEGIIYASRTEAEEHIVRDIEPLDAESKRLRRRVAELEDKFMGLSKLESRLKAVEEKQACAKEADPRG